MSAVPTSQLEPPPPARAPVPVLDYSLTGVNARLAVEKGLAEADWYQSPVPRATMRRLLERRDGPAIRDTLLWFALLAGTGAWGYLAWGTPYAILAFAAYGVLYASVSDSRWHEAGHGTAFQTDWMNNALYELASFMVMRESVIWRWSHARHHSDTIIVGRDPEIAVPRPPNVLAVVLGAFGIPTLPKYFAAIATHAVGRMTAHEKTFVPESEFPKVYRNARIYLAVYATFAVLAFRMESVLPLMYVGLPTLYGSWLMVVYGLTQHAGLAENVLDHRLNCRTVYMNPVNRFLYWNMNYHVEHHMFPLVPYHALPQLHAVVKDDMPAPYPNLLAAWREIVPSVLRQVRDPGYYVKRRLPALRAVTAERVRQATKAGSDAFAVCSADEIAPGGVLRFDYGRKTFALYRDADGKLFATDGICTHGNAHLGDGLVHGGTIECPKHNGRFALADGSPARPPVCRGLATYRTWERDGTVLVDLTHPGGAGARPQRKYRLRVAATRSVATFIREISFVPTSREDDVEFTPGDYLQFEIPAYERIALADLDVPEPYASVWRSNHLTELTARNATSGKWNNYSVAGKTKDGHLLFNVRLAMPPVGQECPPGAGSSYMFQLRPGDEVTAMGPFGDFHVRPTQREMLYIGGGAGMAPLRAHLARLFETEHTARRVSFWYGARSRQELYYTEYFHALAERNANFSFHVALSAPLAADAWQGHVGFIHEVVLEQYLRSHPQPRAVEYYLCGPPQMIKACTRMLAEIGVDAGQILFDEF